METTQKKSFSLTNKEYARFQREIKRIGNLKNPSKVFNQNQDGRKKKTRKFTKHYLPVQNYMRHIDNVLRLIMYLSLK